MNKALIFAGCFLLVFTSCKKTNNVSPLNTVSAYIDGVQESFNTDVFAQLGNGVKYKSSLYVIGGNGNDANADILTITLTVNQTIVPGSYTSGSDATGFVSLQYSDGPFSAANPNSYATDAGGNLTTVIITSLNNTNIQGTFSGKLFCGSAIKTITNGKFNMAIK